MFYKINLNSGRRRSSGRPIFNYKLSPNRASPDCKVEQPDSSGVQLTIDKSLEYHQDKNIISINNKNSSKREEDSVNDERVLMSSEKDILHAVNSFTSKVSNNQPLKTLNKLNSPKTVKTHHKKMFTKNYNKFRK